MIKLLKKSYLYVVFLSLRVNFFSEKKLISQLLKRAHVLDKLNQENKSITYITKEVELCLNEISRRKIKIDDSIKWSMEVLEEAKFDKSNIINIKSNKTKQNISSNFEEIIKSRRSVRKWSNKNVDEKLILKAIDCAQWAPSSCNRQSWFFLVLTQKKHFTYLKKLTNQTFFENADKVIVAFVDLKNYNSSEYTYAFLDLGASIQNLLLELHNLNLGACQFGIKQTKENQKYFKELNNKFNLSSSLIPVSFIAVGNYNSVPKIPGRKDVKEISKFI
jgi:nitroreductase